ncbi:hypothetical protein P5673_012603 [Acropora cervicornis]|uniref:Nucleolar protein Dnt1-like N-terminal domain-containing protein n=1 Tax=Acropora cervicornis TaxID=6130 RepID=A0AAD9QNE3_ACRCE|nr:hypothetical protein P5673_012603 [Acropora cervicornis]
MEHKLRINVVCSSRDRRFLVLAEKKWTVSTFRKITEDVFHELYSDETKLKISGIQNEFHFDIPLNYKVEEVMVDSGLVFVVEKESSFLDVKRTTANDIELFNGDNQGHHHKREKTKTARKKSNSVKTLTQKCVNVEIGDTSCTLIDAVTSTTNPTQATCLMPQVIERISEDSEVDIESIDDTATPSFQASSNMTGVKRRINERKTCQQLLRKARKLKNATQKTPQLIPKRIHNSGALKK